MDLEGWVVRGGTGLRGAGGGTRCSSARHGGQCAEFLCDGEDQLCAEIK